MAIGDESIVLAVLQGITERKRGERELFSDIETVMADMAWFSLGALAGFLGGLLGKVRPVAYDTVRRA